MTPKPYAADLFGNSIPEPTTEQAYQAYINSPTWKRRARNSQNQNRTL